MSISQALNNSLSGLRATQAGLALISANVANAQTAGYVRKSLQLATNASGDSSGSVRVAAVNRELDQYLQRQLRVEAAGGGYADLRADFYTRLQGLYGSPGSTSSLETTFNNFTSAVQSLVTSPDSPAARSVVLSSAQVLTQTLNSLSSDIQGLRSDAENGLAIGDGDTEIAVPEADEPAAILAEDRLIDTEIAGERRPLRRRQQTRLGAEHGGDRVARDQPDRDEDENGNAQQDQRKRCQPLGQVVHGRGLAREKG